jgi:hypothetical protein
MLCRSYLEKGSFSDLKHTFLPRKKKVPAKRKEKNADSLDTVGME